MSLKRLTKFCPCQRAARLGSADGMVNAGTMLRNGIGVDVDLEAAANYFEMGARRGHFACAYEIATMKAQGVGTKR